VKLSDVKSCLVVLLGLFFVSPSVHAEAAWPCFSSKTCFTNPWTFESNNLGIADGLLEEPQAKVKLQTEEELAVYLAELSARRDECVEANSAPKYSGPRNGQSESDALTSYIEEHEAEVRANLSCYLDSNAVDQIISFPADAIGQPDDVYQLEETKKYNASPEFSNCQNYFDILRNRSEGKFETSGLVTKVAFKKYRKYCFDSISTMPESLRDRLVFLAEFTGNTLKQVYCSGILIDQNTVLTAKHCLVDPVEIEDFYLTYEKIEKQFSIQNVRIKTNTRVVAPFLAPYIFSNVTSLNQYPFYPNRPEADYTLLHVQGLSQQLPSPVFSKAEKWDRIMVAGLLPIDPGEATPESESNADIAEWVGRRIVVDSKPSCYVAQLKDGCILHQCQTFAGFSGAPIIRLEDGALVGVHSASLDISENVCKFRRSAIIRNRAADIFGVRSVSQGE